MTLLSQSDKEPKESVSPSSHVWNGRLSAPCRPCAKPQGVCDQKSPLASWGSVISPCQSFPLVLGQVEMCANDTQPSLAHHYIHAIEGHVPMA